jgi:hypothetical protein
MPGVDTWSPKEPPSLGWSFLHQIWTTRTSAQRSANAIPPKNVTAMISRAISSADATIIAKESYLA